MKFWKLKNQIDNLLCVHCWQITNHSIEKCFIRTIYIAYLWCPVWICSSFGCFFSITTFFVVLLLLTLLLRLMFIVHSLWSNDIWYLLPPYCCVCVSWWARPTYSTVGNHSCGVYCICMFLIDLSFLHAVNGFVQSVEQSPFSSLILFWLIFSSVVPFIFLSLWFLSFLFTFHFNSMRVCSPTFRPFYCNC